VVPSPSIPSWLVGLPNRSIGEGAGEAGDSLAAGGEVLVRVGHVPNHEDQGWVVVGEVVDGGGGVPREAKVTDHSDAARVASGAGGGKRGEGALVAEAAGEAAVAAAVVVARGRAQPAEADVMDGAGGVVEQARVRVQLAVHLGGPCGHVRVGSCVGGAALAVPDFAADGGGVERREVGAHLRAARDPGDPERVGVGGGGERDLLGRRGLHAGHEARVRERDVIAALPQRAVERARGRRERPIQRRGDAAALNQKRETLY